jgi:hypothetical protein
LQALHLAGLVIDRHLELSDILSSPSKRRRRGGEGAVNDQRANGKIRLATYFCAKAGPWIAPSKLIIRQFCRDAADGRKWEQCVVS